ncbi:MAG: hypothetical protein GC203_18950 [Phenylobacterium sp.]|uniref:hypothetical protein n=1 Tax=Phenylobacterium sp. TaxID=1871053 RepID=UPI0025D12F76|nr:hypothetical protein [Phenylobacterium sp.]MBI1199943.1 hypothetical protein [Phenylobacterium sp.]
METGFAAKLDFVLKALSISRGSLAAELGVDKSAVARWVGGTVVPSGYNMARLTSFVAARAPGFTGLDWELDLDGLAAAVGAARRGAAPHLRIPLLAESLATTRLRGAAYEGFYRTTRPYVQRPGLFIHDQVMIRAEPDDFLSLRMYAAGVLVEGQVMLLQNQLFFAGAEMTSASFAFAIFNGVSTLKAGVIDGLIMFCALDTARTPAATPAVMRRVDDLSGDGAADEARFAALCEQSGIATDESALEAIRQHLARDFGPAQLAVGGEWVLSLPLVRSLARGMTAPQNAPI